MEPEMSERLEKIEQRATALGWKISEAENQIGDELWLTVQAPDVCCGGMSISAAESLLDLCEKKKEEEAKAKTLSEMKSKITAAFESIGLKDKWDLTEGYYQCPGTGNVSQYAVTIYTLRAPQIPTDEDRALGRMPVDSCVITSTIYFNKEDLEELISRWVKYFEAGSIDKE